MPGPLSNPLGTRLAQRSRSHTLTLCFPGCLSIQGPALVRGPEQGSVTVRCRYSSRWQTHRKWWCRGASWSSCRILIRTTGSEKETKSGRLSIRDDQKNNSFQVTMKMLKQNDTDTYWCGIEKFGTDRGTRVIVTVYSGKYFPVGTTGPWHSGLKRL